MSATYLVHTLVLTPFFASRAFLATFLVALFARLGPSLDVLDSATQQMLQATPPWMTHGATLTVLGGLAALEFAATKNQDARAALNEVDALLKAALSFGVSVALIDSATVEPLQPVLSSVFPALLWAVVPASLVFVMARIRGNALRAVAELDADDALGVQGLLAWGEDCWVLSGFALVVLLPFLAVSLFLLTLLLLFLLHRFVRWMEGHNREACPDCSAAVHPAAPYCGHCGRERPVPLAVGVFGEARRKPAEDLEIHRINLLSARRCPVCAERLAKARPSQECGTCSHRSFASQQELDDYLAVLDQGLPQTMLICLGLGAIPLFGIVPGVIWYRLSLVSAVSRYVPRTLGCLTRVGLNVFNLVMIVFQPVPILGSLTLPIMCFVNYKVYRVALSTSALRSFS